MSTCYKNLNIIKPLLRDLDIIINDVCDEGYRDMEPLNELSLECHQVGTDLHLELKQIKENIQTLQDVGTSQGSILKITTTSQLSHAKQLYFKMNYLHYKQYWLVCGIIRMNEEECHLTMNFDKGIIDIICCYIQVNEHGFMERKQMLSLFKHELRFLEICFCNYGVQNIDLNTTTLTFKQQQLNNIYSDPLDAILHGIKQLNLIAMDINEELDRHAAMLDEECNMIYHDVRPRNQILYELVNCNGVQCICVCVLFIVLFACVGYVYRIFSI